MPNKIPKFTFHLSDPCDEKYRGIEVNGKIVHWIEDTERFVAMFGFTHDMRLAGVTPEQFIRNEYTNHREFDFSACIQSMVIEYLRMHSKRFIDEHGKHCDRWLTHLAKLRGPKLDVCATCKIRPFCAH